MKREYIENSLLKMGVPASIKGFTYIADAVEYIDRNGNDIRITKELYPDIAKMHRVKPQNVERNIRSALKKARDNDKGREIVNHYIGFANKQNFSSLMMLWMVLKQEEGCKNELQNTEKY